jgi:IS5 family transposase
VKFRILEIGRVVRTKGGPNRERLQQGYEKLLSAVGRVVGQAKRFSGEIAKGVKRSADVMQQAALEGLRKELDTIVPRVQQVIRQAKQRIFGGDTHVAEKLVSIFEPNTEIIRKGKASKPTEFGKMVKIQEAENQIITDYTVYEKRPSDSELVIAAIESHRQKLGCVPRLVAGDAAFYSAQNEATAHDRGVQRVCIPSRSTKSAERKRQQKKRWFKQGQKWRTGCEGRISVLKRRHGLRRCLYKGDAGMKRWVGLGVIADNLTHIGTDLAKRK